LKRRKRRSKMSKHIMICAGCGKYTLKESCSDCNKPTVEARPPKYSPEDKYGHLRRQTKEEQYRQKGLI